MLLKHKRMRYQLICIKHYLFIHLFYVGFIENPRKDRPDQRWHHDEPIHVDRMFNKKEKRKHSFMSCTWKEIQPIDWNM